MRTLLLLSGILFFCFAFSYSQPYKYRYYLDDNLNIVPEATAVLTGKAYWDTAGFKVDCFYKPTSKLLLSAYFTDTTLNVLQGPFKSFFSNGQKESEGNYSGNDMTGVWEKWNENGLKTDSSFYDKGIKIRYAKYGYFNKTADKPTEYCFKDSLNNKLYKAYFSEKGYIISEVNFKGDAGLLKTFDSTGLIKEDSVFSRDEIEATFPGGDKAWIIYLQKNLNTEVAANNKAPEGSYKVVIRFIVNKEGVVTNVIAENAPGYGTEKEAIRIIKKSPKWIPAKQYGRTVNAYRRQPITFLVQSK